MFIYQHNSSKLCSFFCHFFFGEHFSVFLLLELEVDYENEDSGLSTPFGLDSKDGLDAQSPASVARSFMRSLDEDPLYPFFIKDGCDASLEF